MGNSIKVILALAAVGTVNYLDTSVPSAKSVVLESSTPSREVAPTRSIASDPVTLHKFDLRGKDRATYSNSENQISIEVTRGRIRTSEKTKYGMGWPTLEIKTAASMVGVFESEIQIYAWSAFHRSFRPQHTMRAGLSHGDEWNQIPTDDALFPSREVIAVFEKRETGKKTAISIHY